MVGLIAKKIGMTSVFDQEGKNVACTVVEVNPNVVTMIKSVDTDGYSALQLGYGDQKEKHTSRQMAGHFAKAGVSPKKRLVEFRNYDLDRSVGDEISLTDVFEEGDVLDATGISKGKGFQGVVKRHNFQGVNDATHGQHNRLRAPGSIGAASYPAKVMKGMRMAGRTGGDRIKMQNLKVVKILEDKNLILIKGAVPGHKGSLIIIEK